MSEDEKQALEVFKKCKIIEERDKIVITYTDLNSIILNLIEKKNKTIEKQNKAIDKMAEHIEELQDNLYSVEMLNQYGYATTKEQIIKYYLGDK